MDETFTVRVAAISDATPRIRQFELVSDGAPLPPFDAGAHIDILAGNGAKRSYSIANDPRERHRYVLAVLREPGGQGSGWLHDHVHPGDTLTVAGPRNAFPVDRSASEHILVAGGVGITPLRSMAYHLHAAGAPFRLIYCTRSAAETAFRDELLASHGERLHLHHDNGDPAGALDLADALRDRPPGAHAYICGPRSMIDAARAATRHWPAGTVHWEVFASPGTAPPESSDMPFEVELAQSGLTLTVPADKTILEVVLAAGVKASYVCREGWCGNCNTGLLSGRADHRDDILDDDEKEAQDQIHICISRALPGERLVLDR